MKPITKRLSLIGLLLTNSAFAAEALKIDLPAVITSADFRPSTAQETPVSLTEINEETIESRGAQHLEEVLNLAPNVNVSSGASRGRFYQIRGMGIRSQYNNPINPSVGLIIDGIDFSRLGGAATMFDIDSVEVLRGPQGTKFGPNAIAGVINMRSAEPNKEFKMRAQTGFAEYNTRNFGAAVSGTIVEDQLLGRASIYTHKSDGYMDNDTLGRDNTQNQDELTFRSKFKLFATEDLTFDFTFLHLNIDNGYDAFTEDNSRNSKSNQPGVDAQKTNAFAVKSNWQMSDAVILQSELTYLNASSTYSFDGDWITDNSGEKYKRDSDNYSFEVRALSDVAGRIFDESTDWTVGLYHFNQDESFKSLVDYTFYGSGLTQLRGNYNTKNTALFGQLDSHLTEKLTLISGARAEYFEAQYDDKGIFRGAPSSLKINSSEMLYGLKLGLNYQANKNQLLYTSLTRGYKPGGINNDNRIKPSDREFNTEYMWNLEAGIKSSWLDDSLMTNLSAFYAKRKDAQTKSSTQDITAGPGDFVEYSANASEATHMGIEAGLDWFLTDKFRVIGSLGLLDTKFDDYKNPDPGTFSPEGRNVANAPSYQYSLGSEWYIAPQWTLRANVEGKDAFYFSDSHNSKSKAYALVNASGDYQFNKNWKVSIWARNLFDKKYATRGFFFDLFRGDGVQAYQQYGEPRVAGVTATYDY